MTSATIVIAGTPIGLDDALERLEAYPSRTPAVYDYPGPGEPVTITADEIARTRQVSSRISMAEGAWFIATAETATWTPLDGDLRDADPAERDGLYDAMLDLYNCFSAAAPKGVNIAKISKVLHLKRPTQFPILDSRLVRVYSGQAALAAKTYADRGFRRMYWAAIRSDLVSSTDGLTALRTGISTHSTPRVRAIQGVSDLRLLDMLTW